MKKKRAKKGNGAQPLAKPTLPPPFYLFFTVFFPLFLLLIFLSPIQSCTPPHREKKKTKTHTTV